MSLGLTALELARIQFAFTVSFHIIFPATSIGLACFLALLEWKWLRTQNPIYKDLFKYWIKIFAVAFGMGVVSGIVMAYQFGTNWVNSLVWQALSLVHYSPMKCSVPFSSKQDFWVSCCLGGDVLALKRIFCNVNGGNRYLYFNVLDIIFQQLDANTSRLCD